jgi:hypothetical protein
MSIDETADKELEFASEDFGETELDLKQLSYKRPEVSVKALPVIVGTCSRASFREKSSLSAGGASNEHHSSDRDEHFVTPVFAHFGVNKVLIDAGELLTRQFVQDLDNLRVPFHVSSLPQL